MKKLLSFAFLSLLLAGGYAHAQAKDDKNMEEKMKHCNAEAKGMKGEERKMKMSECLKGQ